MCIIDLNSINTFLPLICFLLSLFVLDFNIVYPSFFFLACVIPPPFIYIYIYYFTPRSFTTPPFLSFLLFSIEIYDGKISMFYFFLLMPFPTLLLLFTLFFSLLTFCDYESFRVCKIPDVLLPFCFCFLFCLTIIVKFLKFTFYLVSCHNLIS